MAELSTMARPYAKAAFEYAAENGCVDQWSDMLGIAAAVSQQDKVTRMLASPSMPASQMVAALMALLEGQVAQNGENLFSILAHNKRLSLLPQISQQFKALQAEQRQVVDVELTSAFAVEEQQCDELAAKLREKLNRQVNITSMVDSNLIGGARIRAGDLVIDGSVRGKLAKLAEVLNQ